MSSSDVPVLNKLPSILRTGWLVKKSSNYYTYRYVVLHENMLRLYTKPPIGEDFDSSSDEEIALSSVKVTLLQPIENSCEKSGFIITANNSEHEFRCGSIEESNSWIEDIEFTTKEPSVQPSAPQPRNIKLLSNITKKVKILGAGVGVMKNATEKIMKHIQHEPSHGFLTGDQLVVVQKLESLLMSSTVTMGYVANLIFCIIENLPKTPRIERAKRLGQVICIWLGGEPQLGAESSESSSNDVCDDLYPLHQQQRQLAAEMAKYMLNQWFETSLKREIRRSCNIPLPASEEDEEYGDGDVLEGEESPEDGGGVEGGVVDCGLAEVEDEIPPNETQSIAINNTVNHASSREEDPSHANTENRYVSASRVKFGDPVHQDNEPSRPPSILEIDSAAARIDPFLSVSDSAAEDNISKNNSVQFADEVNDISQMPNPTPNDDDEDSMTLPDPDMFFLRRHESSSERTASASDQHLFIETKFSDDSAYYHDLSTSSGGENEGRRIRSMATADSLSGSIASTNTTSTLNNTLFRGDFVETVFLSSFIRTAAEVSGLLNHWLLPALVTVAADPERFSAPLPPIDTAVLHSAVLKSMKLDSSSMERSQGGYESSQTIKIRSRSSSGHTKGSILGLGYGDRIDRPLSEGSGLSLRLRSRSNSGNARDEMTLPPLPPPVARVEQMMSPILEERNSSHDQLESSIHSNSTTNHHNSVTGLKGISAALAETAPSATDPISPSNNKVVSFATMKIDTSTDQRILSQKSLDRDAVSTPSPIAMTEDATSSVGDTSPGSRIAQEGESEKKKNKSSSKQRVVTGDMNKDQFLKYLTRSSSGGRDPFNESEDTSPDSEANSLTFSMSDDFDVMACGSANSTDLTHETEKVHQEAVNALSIQNPEKLARSPETPKVSIHHSLDAIRKSPKVSTFETLDVIRRSPKQSAQENSENIRVSVTKAPSWSILPIKFHSQPNTPTAREQQFFLNSQGNTPKIRNTINVLGRITKSSPTADTDGGFADTDPMHLSLPLPVSSSGDNKYPILDLCNMIFQHMEGNKRLVPSSVSALFETAKKLSVNLCSIHAAESHDGAQNMDGVEYKIFRCLSSALLILRLVSPAITLPSDWHVTRAFEFPGARTSQKRGGIGRDAASMFTSITGGLNQASATDSQHTVLSGSPSFLSPITMVLDRNKTGGGGISGSPPVDRHVAAVVLIAHTLMEGSPMLLLGKPPRSVWGGSLDELRQLMITAEAVAEMVPLQKVTDMVGLYTVCSKPLVEPNVEAAITSHMTRSLLTKIAAVVQRCANLAALSHDDIEHTKTTESQLSTLSPQRTTDTIESRSDEKSAGVPYEVVLDGGTVTSSAGISTSPFATPLPKPPQHDEEIIEFYVKNAKFLKYFYHDISKLEKISNVWDLSTTGTTGTGSVNPNSTLSHSRTQE